MPDLTLLPFASAAPWPSDKPAADASGDGEADFAAVLAAQWPAASPATARPEENDIARWRSAGDSVKQPSLATAPPDKEDIAIVKGAGEGWPEADQQQPGNQASSGGTFGNFPESPQRQLGDRLSPTYTEADKILNPPNGSWGIVKAQPSSFGLPSSLNLNDPPAVASGIREGESAAFRLNLNNPSVAASGIRQTNNLQSHTESMTAGDPAGEFRNVRQSARLSAISADKPIGFPPRPRQAGSLPDTRSEFASGITDTGAPATTTDFDSGVSTADAEEGITPKPAQVPDTHPDDLREGFISRHIKALVGRILSLGRATNDSAEAQASLPTAGEIRPHEQSQFELSGSLEVIRPADPSNGSGEIVQGQPTKSRTSLPESRQRQSGDDSSPASLPRLGRSDLNGPPTAVEGIQQIPKQALPPMGNTPEPALALAQQTKTDVAANAAGVISPDSRKEKSSREEARGAQPGHAERPAEPPAELPVRNPSASPAVMIPPAAPPVSPAPESPGRNAAQDEEVVRRAQVPFAEFYTSSVTTPRNNETAPGAGAARAQGLFKALDRPPASEPHARSSFAEQPGTLPAMPGKNTKPRIPLATDGLDPKTLPPESGVAHAFPPRKNAALSLSGEADIEAAVRDQSAQVTDNAPVMQAVSAKPEGKSILAQRPDLPAMTAGKPPASQFSMPLAEPGARRLREIEIAREQAAPVASAPAQATATPPPAIPVDGEQIRLDAVARPGETTPEVRLKSGPPKAAGELPQVDRLATLPPNDAPRLATVEDKPQQVGMFVNNRWVTPPEDVAANHIQADVKSTGSGQVFIREEATFHGAPVPQPERPGLPPQSAEAPPDEASPRVKPEESLPPAAIPENREPALGASAPHTQVSFQALNQQPDNGPPESPGLAVQTGASPLMTRGKDAKPEIPPATDGHDLQALPPESRAINTSSAQRPASVDLKDEAIVDATARNRPAPVVNDIPLAQVASTTADDQIIPEQLSNPATATSKHPAPPPPQFLWQPAESQPEMRIARDAATPTITAPTPTAVEIRPQAYGPGGKQINANAAALPKETPPELGLNSEGLKAEVAPPQSEQFPSLALNISVHSAPVAPVEDTPQKGETVVNNQRLAPSQGSSAPILPAPLSIEQRQPLADAHTEIRSVQPDIDDSFHEETPKLIERRTEVDAQRDNLSNGLNQDSEVILTATTPPVEPEQSFISAETPSGIENERDANVTRNVAPIYQPNAPQEVTSEPSPSQADVERTVSLPDSLQEDATDAPPAMDFSKSSRQEMPLSENGLDLRIPPPEGEAPNALPAQKPASLDLSADAAIRDWPAPFASSDRVTQTVSTGGDSVITERLNDPAATASEYRAPSEQRTPQPGLQPNEVEPADSRPVVRQAASLSEIAASDTFGKTREAGSLPDSLDSSPSGSQPVEPAKEKLDIRDSATPVPSPPAPASGIQLQAAAPDNEERSEEVAARPRETTPEPGLTLESPKVEGKPKLDSESPKAKDMPARVERPAVSAPSAHPRVAPVGDALPQIEMVADNQRNASPVTRQSLKFEPQGRTNSSPEFGTESPVDLPQPGRETKSPVAPLSTDRTTSHSESDAGEGSGARAESTPPLPVAQQPALKLDVQAELRPARHDATNNLVEERATQAAHHDRLDPQSAGLNQAFVHREATTRSNASGTELEYSESLPGIERERVRSVAPHQDFISPRGVAQEVIGESPVRPAQAETLNAPQATATAENHFAAHGKGSQASDEALDQKPVSDPPAHSSFAEERPAKPGPRGEANNDAAAGDLPVPVANNAAVPQPAGAKAEGQTTTVKQLTPTLIEASERLTPGKPRTLRLSLRPVELGQVEVQVTRDAKGHVNAHLTVEREAAGQTLSEGIPQLREALERAGLQVDRLVVSTGTSSNGEGQAQQAPAQQFTRTSGPDFFEAEPANTGGTEAAEDRLLNLHA